MTTRWYPIYIIECWKKLSEIWILMYYMLFNTFHRCCVRSIWVLCKCYSSEWRRLSVWMCNVRTANNHLPEVWPAQAPSLLLGSHWTDQWWPVLKKAYQNIHGWQRYRSTVINLVEIRKPMSLFQKRSRACHLVVIVGTCVFVPYHICFLPNHCSSPECWISTEEIHWFLMFERVRMSLLQS